VISPLPIAPQYRARYDSLIDEAEGSGSGVFLRVDDVCSASSA
jgi:hypothetical protein